MKAFFTVAEAAIMLQIDQSLVARHCRDGRLAYTHGKHSGAWIITPAELATFRQVGKKRRGRPRKSLGDDTNG